MASASPDCTFETKLLNQRTMHRAKPARTARQNSASDCRYRAELGSGDCRHLALPKSWSRLAVRDSFGAPNLSPLLSKSGGAIRIVRKMSCLLKLCCEPSPGRVWRILEDSLEDSNRILWRILWWILIGFSEGLVPVAPIQGLSDSGRIEADTRLVP